MKLPFIVIVSLSMLPPNLINLIWNPNLKLANSVFITNVKLWTCCNIFLSSLRTMELQCEMVSIQSQDSMFDYERIIRMDNCMMGDSFEHDSDIFDTDLIPILKRSCSFSSRPATVMIRHYIAEWFSLRWLVNLNCFSSYLSYEVNKHRLRVLINNYTFSIFVLFLSSENKMFLPIPPFKRLTSIKPMTTLFYNIDLRVTLLAQSLIFLNLRPTLPECSVWLKQKI